ncbi:MAG: GNAT family N-acetyltransferase [Bacteroidales bacterium]|nr:GNAT family N-acetyltransferase [Bacteroidales bacterium]
MDITIKPLSPDLLKDFLFFFDHIVFTEHPDWSVCYCYSFHFTGTKAEWNRENNRASAIRLIQERKMKGYLFYSDGKPVGWCNANNRLNYESLLKYYDLPDIQNEKVCSVVCFLIHPEYRRKGITRKMLERICKDYAIQEYECVEAYPGKGHLTSEGHYMGPLSLYEQFDFKVVHELKDHYVVRKDLRGIVK